MKNKGKIFKLSIFGFTLIEILTIIIVLAAIALITIPIVINTIETAKQETYKRSVEFSIDAADNYLIENELKEFPSEGINVTNLNMRNNDFTGGKIMLNANNKLEAYNVSNGIYCAVGEKRVLKVIKGDCYLLDETPPVEVKLVSNAVTTNSIKVIAFSVDTESGIKGYKYSKDNGESYTEIISNNTYEFTKLSKNTKYSLKVIAINNNNLETKSATLEITTTDIAPPTYNVSNALPTNNNVNVTITYPSNKESSWKYEYKKDSENWITASNNPLVITFTNNGTIIARIVDELNNENTVVGSQLNIANIDKEAPTPPILYVNDNNLNITSPNTSYKLNGFAEQESNIEIYENNKYLKTIKTNNNGLFETTVNVSKNVTFEYYTIAVDLAKNKSNKSNLVSIKSTLFPSSNPDKGRPEWVDFWNNRNYAKFEKDSSIWRIISGQNNNNINSIKLVREASIGNYAFDRKGTGDGTNNWEGKATINTYLNNTWSLPNSISIIDTYWDIKAYGTSGKVWSSKSKVGLINMGEYEMISSVAPILNNTLTLTKTSSNNIYHTVGGKGTVIAHGYTYTPPVPGTYSYYWAMGYKIGKKKMGCYCFGTVMVSHVYACNEEYANIIGIGKSSGYPIEVAVCHKYGDGSTLYPYSCTNYQSSSTSYTWYQWTCVQKVLKAPVAEKWDDNLKKAVKPVVNIKIDSIIIGGNGTINNPYIIK